MFNSISYQVKVSDLKFRLLMKLALKRSLLTQGNGLVRVLRRFENSLGNKLYSR